MWTAVDHHPFGFSVRAVSVHLCASCRTFHRQCLLARRFESCNLVSAAKVQTFRVLSVRSFVNGADEIIHDEQVEPEWPGLSSLARHEGQRWKSMSTFVSHSPTTHPEINVPGRRRSRERNARLAQELACRVQPATVVR